MDKNVNINKSGGIGIFSLHNATLAGLLCHAPSNLQLFYNISSIYLQ